MNVGDFVRYKYENIVYIGKIKFISETMGFDETLQFDIDNCMEEILKQDIIKSSPQIIDLIEKNDLITLTNEYFKDEVYRVIGKLKGIVELDLFEDGTMQIGNDDIKTVVTHEQIKAMQYRVEE